MTEAEERAAATLVTVDNRGHEVRIRVTDTRGPLGDCTAVDVPMGQLVGLVLALVDVGVAAGTIPTGSRLAIAAGLR